MALIAAVAALLLCLAPTASAAQTATDGPSKIDSLNVRVFFPQGISEINFSLRGNGARLVDFSKQIDAVISDPSAEIERVHIVGYASPEGPAELNSRLALERAESLAEYLRIHNNLSDTVMLVESLGIDWEALYSAVGRSTLENRDDVQTVIRQEPETSYDVNGSVVRTRKQTLEALDNGRTWRWMTDNLYPELRSAVSAVCYVKRGSRAPQTPAATAAARMEESADDSEPLPAAAETASESESYNSFIRFLCPL